MPQPLIPDRGRPAALIAIAVSALAVVALAAVVWHGTTTSFDTWAFVRAYRDFGAGDSTHRRFWLAFTEPAVSLLVPALIVLGALIAGTWRVAALTAIGPPAALGLTEVVGKPLVDRVLGPGVLRNSYVGAVHGSFPSGHETGATAWLVVVVVLVLRSSARRDVRVVTTVGAAVWALAGALGLTVNYYHYATDTLAGIGVSVAVVLGVALAVDAVAPRLDRRVRSAGARRSGSA